MRIGKLLLIILCIGTLASCNRNNTITFKGTLRNESPKYIYLSKVTVDGVILLDSAEVKRGKFALHVKAQNDQEKEQLADPAFYRISFNPDNAFTTLAHAGEHLEINAAADSLIKTYTITGGHDAELIQQLDHQLKLFIDTTWFLETAEHFINPNNDSLREVIEVYYLKTVDCHTRYLRKFIDENMNSLAAITAFYQVYNKRRFFDETKDIELLKKIYENLIKIYPNNENVLFLKQRIDLVEYKKTMLT